MEFYQGSESVIRREQCELYLPEHNVTKQVFSTIKKKKVDAAIVKTMPEKSLEEAV